ncbi:MAG: CHAT domain-containing protein [Acidobacteriota bacterium]
MGEAALIDQSVGELRRALRNPRSGDAKQLARTLDEKVMRPLRQHLGARQKILLSPDGALNLIPFAALVDEHDHYLVNRYLFIYLTSGRDLLRLRIKQESQPAALVLADPAFDSLQPADSAALRDIKPVHGGQQPGAPWFDFSAVQFKSLPGTASEATALRALLPEASILTGGAATESALKQLRRPRLLHIATHGYFLKDLVLSQTIQSDANAPRLPDNTAESENIENPLLRSGLALAGANRRKSGEEDGILTALEATGLDLWGTKLVVLSACDTGVGEVKNGEGVYGLKRAFVLAGSESQVMSLWAVSDMGTKELMVEYYKRLLRGEGRGEALRQVQLRMLKNPKRSHPFYWASFIQSGEWANLDGKR